MFNCRRKPRAIRAIPLQLPAYGAAVTAPQAQAAEQRLWQVAQLVSHEA